MALTLDQVRELLGAEADDKTDAELLSLRDRFAALARAVLQISASRGNASTPTEGASR